jgi:carbon storage regulator
MLVLSRKIGERILVPDRELAITVVAIEGNRVRLGISAPTDIGVYREEVWRNLSRKAPGCPAKG